ncbi:uncharacterized protein FIBRA_07069 [Fibroporia radiculosa]|uniref:Uncharacterized protein n=1 Tax=Fibroporia radiculosa TaxID=599839 RepID=J4IBL6_9APHY|nr:uncharacterized protein FIBRA_07069 [Fibroporia radiculosa]CCM04876.1 predicted protein [Fibroporia radiculosa]
MPTQPNESQRRATGSEMSGEVPPPYSELPPTNNNTRGPYLSNQNQRSRRTSRDAYAPSNNIPSERSPLNGNTRNTRPAYSTFSSYTFVHLATSERFKRRAVLWPIVFIFMVFMLVGSVMMQTVRLQQCKLSLIPNPEQREMARREWDRERVAHQQEVSGWNRDRAAHEKEMAKVRSDWNQERMDHQRERDQWLRERKEWEQKVEERKKQCVAFGTREYVAQLGFNPMTTCKEMPLNIEDQVMDPLLCQVRGKKEVEGHWHVDGEPGCMPYWGSVDDKGCVAPGIHSWEARLWDLSQGDNWLAICSTAPADIAGRHFDSPTSCQDRGFFNGIVGVFHSADPSC